MCIHTHIHTYISVILMKISVLAFQGLVSLFFVAVPVYAIALGVILRCNATLRSHITRRSA